MIHWISQFHLADPVIRAVRHWGAHLQSWPAAGLGARRGFRPRFQLASPRLSCLGSSDLVPLIAMCATTLGRFSVCGSLFDDLQALWDSNK